MNKFHEIISMRFHLAKRSQARFIYGWQPYEWIKSKILKMTKEKKMSDKKTQYLLQ